MAVERFEHGAEGSDYVFTDGHEPPSFVVVAFYGEDDRKFYTTEPLSRAQLDAELASESSNAEDTDDNTCIIEGSISESYRGGRDQAALRIARFVLADD